MVEDIIALLILFEGNVPDNESNKAVLNLVENNGQWKNAHDLFDKIRKNNLKAIKNNDSIKETQYCFEEVCTQSIYNLTQPNDPFDSDSPHWIIKNALSLAYKVGLPAEDVINIVAPKK